MARSEVQRGSAWAELLELVGDECEVVSTPEAVRRAILGADNDLRRLRRVEGRSKELVGLVAAVLRARIDSLAWDVAIRSLWSRGRDLVDDLELLSVIKVPVMGPVACEVPVSVKRHRVKPGVSVEVVKRRGRPPKREPAHA